MESFKFLISIFSLALAAFALASVAIAIEASPFPHQKVMKSDRIGTAVAADSVVTVEEVNLDAGISNIVRIETEPTRL